MLSQTIGSKLEEITNKYPNNEAIVYPNKIRLSYKEFNERVDILAKALMALRIQKNDHIGLWATNILEWILIQFASAKIGAPIVLVNTYYKTRELDYLLHHADIKIFFFSRGFKDINYYDVIKSLVPNIPTTLEDTINSSRYPHLRHIIFLGDQPPEPIITHHSLYELSHQISDEQYTSQKNTLSPHDVINIQYTSGTTGYPKGVMLTHYNILNNAIAVGQKLGLSEKDRMCIPVPFFHCFGCVLSILNCICNGATMIPLETFHPEQVLQIIQNEQCTILNGVPTMFISELQHPNFTQYNLSSLRTGIMAGAPCPVEIMQQVMEKMSLREITICYGLTEASPVITQTDRHDPLEKRVETVGKPVSNVQAIIIDPLTGSVQPPNTPGELVVKGYNIMKGYYKMPDQTNTTIINGWLHTKDLALKDENGYVKILGRIDDMIIRGGENIYPREIEEFLYTHEKIKEVAVVGVPNEKYGEEVFAFIQLKDGMIAISEEIRDFCKDKISQFKIPKYIQFVEDYPITASGKIQKYRLREIAQEQLSHNQLQVISK
ncbi:MAG: AMP-binding protein [Candidatus Thermoplasmatota archaeon]|nr:AMP-binding protein [Candidatus Thermoplasmatota archaeon]MBU1941052.1 AMP-binding protein [Candidatus Thermoplasmatota archaeon]